MQRSRLIRPLLIGFGLTLLVFFAYGLGLLDPFELKSLDWRFRIRGAISPQAPIILVSIDQDSFDELNLPWPWPRTLHAELVRKLAQAGPKVVGIDVLFPEPKPDAREDQALADAVREARNVILAAEYTDIPTAFGPRKSVSLPIVPIRESALGYGGVNLSVDPDGIVRRAAPTFRFQDRLYASFAYRIYQALTGAKDADFTDPMIINFRGPARTYPTVPYYRVLRGEIDASYFRDRIVLVGAFSPSLHDQFSTPFRADQPTAGVEIQANFIDTLLAKDPIVQLPGSIHALFFFLLAGLTIATSLSLRPLRALGAFLVLGAVYALTALIFFSRGHAWLPLVPGLVGAAVSYTGITLDGYIREQKERLRLRATFAKYVSADVLEEILRDQQGLGLTGKRRHITVLFADIRGFTSISERITPEQVVSLLSEYLARATEVIFRHGGTVDKFIGDAVMAVYGAPKVHGDDALRAVKTGLELIRLADSLGSEWLRVTGRSLEVGVGIHSGDAVVGSIGSDVRSDFTAIGDTVNLASRLEGLTKQMGVPLLISEFAAKELNEAVPLKPLGQVRVIGREAPFFVYTVEDLGEDRSGTGPVLLRKV